MYIGIIGLGLIGGSISKAIKKTHAENSYIIGYDTDDTSCKLAYEEGVINHIATDLTSSFSQCSVIFLCTPVHTTLQIVQTLLPSLPNDCILTDVGSTKYEVVYSIQHSIEESRKRIYFVGGHPMTGSEKSGYHASSAALFENTYYILTPTAKTPEFILFILQKMAERIGAIPIILSPTYHDFATATISHLPHIIASSLVHLVKESDSENHHLHTLAAGGFKDITRIASSHPAVWQSICLSNKEKIQKALTRYESILQRFRQALNTNDEKLLYQFFDTARLYRNTFSETTIHNFIKHPKLYVDIKDEPGAIAKIATHLSSHHINIKNIGVVTDREFSEGVISIVFNNQSDLLEASQLLTEHHYCTYY